MAALPVSVGQLSPLTDVNVPRQGLRPGFAARWPALGDVPWFPAVGDGATVNIGSGCVSPQRVALTVGTTSAVRAVLQLGDLPELEPTLAVMEPDAHGLTVLPFLAGERSPGWAGHARATIYSLSLSTTPLGILHAGPEAVAYWVAMVFDGRISYSVERRLIGTRGNSAGSKVDKGKIMINIELDQLCVNTIRVLAMDAVQRANSGHPGMPMGMADAAYVLWTRFLKHNPANPKWPDRDRFVLSAGHGSMLLYSLLHLTGYDLSLEELKNFRQWGSKTPGHPENHLAPGVETTTGPLGQGFANGVGMALAERILAAYFNRPGFPIVDHYTYSIVSDGDLMEGVSHEAASFAGHLGLGKLIYLYDDNGISIDGPTDLTFTENVRLRFEAYNWHTVEINGHDRAAVATAIEEARAETERPSLIIAHTHIAYGSPNKQDTAAAHGEPLGEEEVRLTKQRMGWPPDAKFLIPDEVLAVFRRALAEGVAREAGWRALFERYAEAYPDLAATWEQVMAGQLPDGWEKALPSFTPEDGPMATRVASGKVLNAIAGHIPTLIGGSADLHPSNKTYLTKYAAIKRGYFSGRNIHFGVREHTMAGILNGMALHGGLFPYGGTFLVFSDYMRPSLRLSAMMKLPIVYVFTHDSIGLGEDGPTHQPVEHIPSLRAIPHLTLIRPADANETVEAWRVALKRREGPTALLLTRQGLPILDRREMAPASGLARGAYVLADVPDPDVILIASGSEVAVALKAQALLVEEGVAARVVSMPSWELFEEQPQEYKDSILPPTIQARVAVEAAAGLGWCRYVGDKGVVVSVEQFGTSAPYKVIFEKYGFTPENVAEKARECVREAALSEARA